MSTPFALLADHARTALGDRFEIGEELGAGGQGVVFRATRRLRPDGTTTADRMALKIHFDPDQDERVAREIAAMHTLRDPTLATMLEHGTLRVGRTDVRFIAWEFIAGESLSHRLARGPLAPWEVAAVGRDVATALGLLATNQIVHRDVNPKNVMLRVRPFSAVLIDLGCARHLDQSTLTGAWGAVGTAGYMSPEQARGERELTSFSDVFALGVTLTTALRAEHPTDGRQDRLLTERVRATTLAPEAPAELTNLIDRMLDPRPAFRPRPSVVMERCTRLTERSA